MRVTIKTSADNAYFRWNVDICRSATPYAFIVQIFHILTALLKFPSRGLEPACSDQRIVDPDAESQPSPPQKGGRG